MPKSASVCFWLISMFVLNSFFGSSISQTLTSLQSPDEQSKFFSEEKEYTGTENEKNITIFSY